MNKKKWTAVRMLIILFLLVSVIFPLVGVMTHITLEDAKKIMTSEQFLPMIGHSLATTGISTVISVSLASLWRGV